MIVGPQDLDAFWDGFLPFVEARRVVPVIGPELLRVAEGGAHRPLHAVVAERLAQRLRVDPGGPAPRLNDVVCRFLQQRGRREDVYLKLHAVMKELSPEPAPELLALARVTGFDLFVTLGFDGLMVRALDLARHDGRPRTQHLAYAPHKFVDLPCDREQLTGPLVYGLFGKLSVGPDYVITDEDLLEFLCALQTDARRPPLLFDALQSSHLLFLGCSFQNWLARFFMRIAKGRLLSQQRGDSELLIDPAIGNDADLVLFLENFSYGTRMLAIEPLAFIAELERRWSARQPSADDAPGADAGEPPALRPGGVFLSYAKEDAMAALRLREALEAVGVDVWFDTARLQAGDAYDLRIRRAIQACALFVPLVSRHTEARVEGYFRREWRWAEERSWSRAEGVPFILPVVIDDTQPYGSAVPEAFLAPQWTELPDARSDGAFEARVVRLVREHRRRERALEG